MGPERKKTMRSRSSDTYQNVRVGEIASAEGLKLPLPNARSPSRLGVWGIVVSFYSGVYGQAAQTDSISNILCQHGVHFWDLVHFIL